MTPRLQQILQWLENEPNDAFLLYAAATEYRNFDLQKATEFFELLLTSHPQYLPTYYHAAQLYMDLKNPEKAEITYKNGIALAKQQKEQKALAELQSAYNNFLFEE